MRSGKTQLLSSALILLLRDRLLLPLLAAMLLVLSLAANYGGQLVETQLLQNSRSVGFAATNYLMNAGDELESIEYIMPGGSENDVRLAMEANWQAHGFYDTFYFLDRDGRVQIIVPDDPRYKGLDMSSQGFFREVDCDLEINISNPFTSLRTGQPTVFLTLCTRNDGFLVGELNLGALQEAISAGEEAQKGTVVFVVDQVGTLLAHPDYQLVAQKTNISNWKTVSQGLESDSIVRYWRNGNLWIGSTSRILPTDWIVVTEVPMLTVYSPYVGSFLILLLLFILIFSIMLQGFMHQVQVQLIAPLARLSEETDAIASGNYSTGERLSEIPAAYSEIEHLLANFQSMGKAILSRESLIKESEEQYRRLVEYSPNAIIVHSDGQILYANKTGAELYGASSVKELLGKSIFDILHPDSHARVQARLRKLEELDQSGTLALAEQQHVRLDQSVFDAEVVTTSIYFDGQKAAQTIVQDITKRKDEEQRLRFQATHDFLTELPNRLLFQDRLEYILLNARRKQTSIAVLYLDLDNFKSVNDALGHDSGDFLLQQIARVLRSSLRQGDMVARISGDEFAVLIDELKDPKDSVLVANTIIQAFSKPILVQDEELLLSFSIGISIFPDDGHDTQSLLQAADAAMYEAKKEGKNRFKFYSSDMRLQSMERFTISSQLYHAMGRDELFLEYQPQIDHRSGKLVGVEALLRWRHPELGLVSPNRFIPLAEENGMILSIGEWVTQTACRQGHAWQKISKDPIRVSINLSNLQLKQPDLSALINNILEQTGFSPQLLELELTENIVFQNASASFEKLHQLKSLGVGLAIDDFGTGYSTLGYLAHFPIDRLKIDQRLAANIMTDNKEAAIVAGIITISHNLGLQVVAEGVETAEQLDFYTHQGCHIFQGWYYSKAVRPEQITEFITQKKKW